MRILIVDDILGWILFHRQNLEYLHIKNLEVDTAISANEALSKIEVSLDKPYDVIFTDLQMETDYLPKYAGEWLIEQIKMFDEYKNTKITIISASQSIKQIAKKYKVNSLSKIDARNADCEIYRQYI